MHQGSYRKMATFKETFLWDRLGRSLTILDIGSQDVNGSYKSLFTEPHWTYHGADLIAGQNVDIVLKNPYTWREIKSASYDVVISGQTLEHTEYFWLTMLEMARVLKNNGLCCVIAPSSGPVHRYPVDCFRFYKDGMIALAKFAGLSVLQVQTEWMAHAEDDFLSTIWHDSSLIAQKLTESLGQRIRRYIQHKALQLSIKHTTLNAPTSSIDPTPSEAMLLSETSGNLQFESFLLEQIQAKEEEINHLTKACAEREALINQLSAVCIEREALINQLSAVCIEREARINQLSVVCAEREARINQLS